MGIKFRCPNGHKIHVKAHLAGREGLCPDCGVPVRAPVQSTAENPTVAANGGFDPLGLEGDERDDFGLPPTAVQTVAAPIPQFLDPTAIWYAQLPSGRQLGPAGGREMQRWAQDGTLRGAALVWRDGWPEWQTFSKILPNAVGNRAEKTNPLAIPDDAGFSSPSAIPSTARFQKRGRRRIPPAATFLLMALVVILFAILMYVFVLRS